MDLLRITLSLIHTRYAGDSDHELYIEFEQQQGRLTMKSGNNLISIHLTSDASYVNWLHSYSQDLLSLLNEEDELIKHHYWYGSTDYYNSNILVKEFEQTLVKLGNLMDTCNFN